MKPSWPNPPCPSTETDIVHRVRDGSADLEFRWAFPSEAVLDQFDLLPLPLHALIETAMPSWAVRPARGGGRGRTRRVLHDRCSPHLS